MSSKFYGKQQNNAQKQQLEKQSQLQQRRQTLPSKIVIEHSLQASHSQPMFPMISSSSHPVIALTHIILKIATVGVFIVFPIFSDSFFVKQIVVILAAIDFWIVKNITGRLLVGLRWWVDFEQNGDEKWKFECKVNEKDVNPADQKVFWWTLALFCLIWLLLSVANTISLNITNLIICLFCLVMIGFNLYSYYRCSKAQSDNIKKLAYQYGTNAIGKFMTGSIIANYF